MCTYFKTETDAIQNLNVHVFQDRNWCNTKSNGWFFFLTLAVRRPFHRNHFKLKEYGSTGLLSGKTEALHVELSKGAEAATSSYSAEVDFLQYIYSVLVAKNH